MKVAALVLGILGGLAGLLGGTCALAVGGIGEALGAEGAEEVIGLGWLAFVAAIVVPHLHGYIELVPPDTLEQVGASTIPITLTNAGAVSG